MHASGYLRRLLAAGTVGVALLAVTALGTGGSAGDGSGATGLAYLLPAAIAAVALLVGLVAWSDRPLTKLARFVLHVMALSAPLIVLGLLAAAATREHRRVTGLPRKPVPQVPAPLQTATPPPRETATPARAPAGGGSGTTPVWVALAALALVSGAAVFVAGRRGRHAALPRMRRRAREPGEDEPASLGDPAAIADPRASIIAAFARLEAELRAADMARRRGEGPIEYTERVAAARPDLAQPVRRLARVYAPARFSEHPVDAAMRREALVALDAVRHGLAPDESATVATEGVR